jgi:hypothetical protein
MRVFKKLYSSDAERVAMISPEGQSLGFPRDPLRSASLRAFLWTPILFCLLAIPLYAAKLDFSSLEKAYLDGELQDIKVTLEDFLKENSRTASRQDLIFAYKYLGVIYAADSISQPKAESYFHQLFTLAPRIEILDLYPSARIQDIFRRVKMEFKARAEYADQYDSFGNPVGDPAGVESESASAREKSSRTQAGDVPSLSKKPSSPDPSPRKTLEMTQSNRPSLWLWVGGAALLGGGVFAYWWFSQEPERENQKL